MPRWKPLIEVSRPARTETGRWFVNGRYQVAIFDVTDTAGEACLEITIRREDRKAIFDWRDVQKIKNELLGPEEEMVQLFPAEKRLVDTSNQYYFYAYPGKQWPFGFQKRAVNQNIRIKVQEGGGYSEQRPFRDEHRPVDLEKQEDSVQKALDSFRVFRKALDQVAFEKEKDV